MTLMLPAARTDQEKTPLQRQITDTDRRIDHLVYDLYPAADQGPSTSLRSFRSAAAYLQYASLADLRDASYPDLAEQPCLTPAEISLIEESR